MPSLGYPLKGSVKLAGAGRIQNQQTHARNLGCGLDFSYLSGTIALRGFVNRATIAPVGNNSRSICSRFGANSTSSVVVPVTLPPGMLKLGTRPLATGSPRCERQLG
jgi:hypothetical protein